MTSLSNTAKAADGKTLARKRKMIQLFGDDSSLTPSPKKPRTTIEKGKKVPPKGTNSNKERVMAPPKKRKLMELSGYDYTFGPSSKGLKKENPLIGNKPKTEMSSTSKTTNEPQKKTGAAQVRQDAVQSKEQGRAFEYFKGQNVKIYTVEELSQLLRAAKYLGKGTYGTVSICQTPNGRIVIKQFKENLQKDFVDEARNLVMMKGTVGHQEILGICAERSVILSKYANES